MIVGVLKDAFTYQEVFAMFSCVSTLAVITTVMHINPSFLKI